MRVRVTCCACGPRLGSATVTIPPTETDPLDIQTPEEWLLIERDDVRYAYCPSCCCPDCVRMNNP